MKTPRLNQLVLHKSSPIGGRLNVKGVGAVELTRIVESALDCFPGGTGLRVFEYKVLLSTKDVLTASELRALKEAD